MTTWDARRRQEPAHGVATDAVEAFRNLCRSSPWRWQSLQFDYWDEPFSDGPTPGSPLVRAWLRRPGALRLESAEGLVLHSTPGINDSRDGLYVSATRKSWLLPPRLVTPVFDANGLVRRRPEAAYGEPSFGNGRLAAALDPVELAGKAPVPLEFPGTNTITIHSVTSVEHGDRAAFEAEVSPNTAYRPGDAAAPLCWPGRSLVRLDAATGVCVASRGLEADSKQWGHWLCITEVDAYMPDEPFLTIPASPATVRQHIRWDTPA